MIFGVCAKNTFQRRAMKVEGVKDSVGWMDGGANELASAPPQYIYLPFMLFARLTCLCRVLLNAILVPSLTELSMTIVQVFYTYWGYPITQSSVIDSLSDMSRTVIILQRQVSSFMMSFKSLDKFTVLYWCSTPTSGDAKVHVR